MTWFIQPQQTADAFGNGTGRWRMTATSDEDGGGPFGDSSHDHSSAEEAQSCEKCDEYTSSISGFPSKKRREQEDRDHDLSELERLKSKYPE